MGKNSIAQIALGRNPEEEYKDNLRHISKVLKPEVVHYHFNIRNLPFNSQSPHNRNLREVLVFCSPTGKRTKC